MRNEIGFFNCRQSEGISIAVPVRSVDHSFMQLRLFRHVLFKQVHDPVNYSACLKLSRLNSPQIAIPAA